MKRFISFVIIGAVTCLVAGCVGQPSGPRTNFAAPSEITGHAVLDRQSATITLPLDQYGMNQEEFQTVLAAQQIVFAQCVTASSAISPVTVNAARDTLQYRETSSEWLYGFWDADYIAADGWQGTPHGIGLGEGLDAEASTLKACVNSQEYLDLLPVQVGYYGGPDGVVDNLTRYESWAYDRAVADPRFIDLMETRAACITAAGYTIDNSGSYAAISLDPSWTAEERLKAVVTAAQCDDDGNITQQMADIHATYQQQYIDANQAELTTIRATAEERVARATQILRDAGVM